MKLTVTRLEHGKYKTEVTRDDGASYRLKGVAHTFAIPHDLAHFWSKKPCACATAFSATLPTARCSSR